MSGCSDPPNVCWSIPGASRLFRGCRGCDADSRGLSGPNDSAWLLELHGPGMRMPHAPPSSPTLPRDEATIQDNETISAIVYRYIPPGVHARLWLIDSPHLLHGLIQARSPLCSHDTSA